MQAKGGVSFANYGTFLKTLDANGIAIFNTHTDTNPNSAGNMVTAAQTDGINVLDWELGNEPYCCSKIYATATDYLSAQNPYYLNMVAANSNVTTSVFMQGQFSGYPGYMTWDSAFAAFPSPYWQSITYHVYPVTTSTLTTAAEEQLLNGVLAHGTTEYFNSYVVPLVGPNIPIFISEFNSDGLSTLAFESYIYNAIYMAEFVARMSTIPQVKAVGATALYLGNIFSEGLIRAVDDYESYLISQVEADSTYSTDTSTNPNTQFSFYYSAPALGLEIVNQAVNSSNATWATTVNGGPTVPISGYDGQPVPAVYAQGYQGTDGTHYLVITNKSGSSVPMAIEVNGTLLENTVTISYISSTSDTTQNTASQQNNVQIVTTTSPNPITIGPYSVTRVQW